MKDRSKNGTFLAIGGGAVGIIEAGMFRIYPATVNGAAPLDVALIAVQAAAAAILLTAGIWGLRVPGKRRVLGVWAIAAGIASLLGVSLLVVLFGVAGGLLMRTAPASTPDRQQVPPGIKGV